MKRRISTLNHFVLCIFLEPFVELVISFGFHFRSDVFRHFLYEDGERGYFVKPADDRQALGVENVDRENKVSQ